MVAPADAAAREYRTPMGTLAVSPVPPPFYRPGWHVRALARTLAAIRAAGEQPVLYIQGSPCTPVALAAMALMPRLRAIYHTQDFLEPASYPVRLRIEGLVARRAGAVICNEPNRARFLQSIHRLRNPPVVLPTRLPAAWPRPVDAAARRRELVSSLPNRPAGEVQLICAGGSYGLNRCGDVLVKAVARLPESCALVFTGTEPGSRQERDAVAAAENASVRGRVLLLGFLPHGKLLETYAACDAGTLLYPNDGIGNYYQAPGRLAEYAACGLPMVASDFPGLSTVLREYGLGRCVDSASPEDVAEGLRSLLLLVPEAKRAEERSRIMSLSLNALSYNSNAELLENTVRRVAG